MTTTPDLLKDAVSRVEIEIGRTDTKASLLLAFTGAAAAGLVTIAVDPPALNLAAKLLGGIAITLLLLAADLLLCVVRPQLGGDDRASFPYWAECTPGAIREQLAETSPEEQDYRVAARIGMLSELAVLKFKRLQQAVGLLRAAVLLIALAAAIAAA